ncbi:SPOR domain-containing protein [Erythrobacter ani]|uniref:Tetratricopeptide repeat protein n=1 Tax=Erythrobacter ani TaxID=2827235 RepID=A0ABS6SK58_9SPHN|nr:SPOR domain-containing protein [Erythrobacter ani]MBV7264848.1 tetratricopeptide repeat protein [Erythrobacter ani]
MTFPFFPFFDATAKPFFLLGTAFAASFLVIAPAAAQDATARAVVQPLPSKETQGLNRALMRLAKSPNSVDALIDAGEASVKVGDLDAAIGFYGRAEDLSPNNPRVKLGMASVYLRSGRPVDALPLYAAAQSAGAAAKDLLSDRGLAFDLVGDSAGAQAAYKRAITLSPEDMEARRRLALSYAITGNRAGFEDTLRPMLDRRDLASFRTRAFGLAILGEQDRASAIVDAVMPRDLAGRITPYLAYMPRLTRSQQAAAANLGIFPRAADIGRDDPRIAAFVSGAGDSGPVRDVASRLEPAGEPLGAQRQAAVQSEPTAAQPASVADAFADMGSGSLPDAAATGNAVNLAALEIPREVEQAETPTKPAHPSRIWVQVATGRDIAALKFDWRRLAGRAPDLLGEFDAHVTPWGQANRLLAGPVADRSEARDLINALKEKGIDAFRFESLEGTEIKELK